MILKADLHVHTPASYCYETKGRADSDYVAIIRKAVDSGLHIIAITDHNTIAGYARLLSIKNTCATQIHTLRSIAEMTDEIQSSIKQIESVLSLFDSLLILPGVEITLTPGVHMILIADIGDESFISSLLTRIGCSDDSIGKDDCSSIDTSVTEFLNMPEIKDKLVLAPHIDSDNGIYNVLRGQYRARVFRHESLRGISCNSPITLAKIKSIYTQPEYLRLAPIAYFNSSDAHCVNTIAQEVTYLRIDSADFRHVYDAFSNPEQCISDSPDPDMLRMFLKNTHDSNSIILKNDFSDLDKSLCACLNNGYASMIVGLNYTKDGFSGIPLDRQGVIEKINEVSGMLASLKRNYLIRVSTQQLGNGSYAHMINIRCTNPSIWYIESEGASYFLDHVGGMRKATISDIETTVSSRLMSKYEEVDKKINSTLDEVVLSMRSIMSPFSHENLANRVALVFSKIQRYVNVVFVEKNKLVDPKEYGAVTGVGNSSGNLFYMMDSKPRLPNSYLRFSGIRIGNINTYNNVSETAYCGFGPAIALTESGGCYLIDQDKWYLAGEVNTILIIPREEISPYAIIAWLKSTVCLWITLWENDTGNLYNPSVLNNLYVPDHIYLKACGGLDNISRKIVDFENEFIELFNRTPEHEQDQLIYDFNSAVREYIEKLDDILREICEFTEDDMNLIIRYIVNKKYVNCSKSIDVS